MSGQRSIWRERPNANPSRMELELAFKLQEGRISYQTQVEIPATTADFYFPTEGRPLIVFVDGKVHLKTSQAIKDEDLRTLLRKRGYRVLELFYDYYSDKKRDDLYVEILEDLGSELSCTLSKRISPRLEAQTTTLIKPLSISFGSLRLLSLDECDPIQDKLDEEG